MIRRFNFTERKKISRSAISLTVQNSPRRELRDAAWRIDEYEFPDDAAVYLEATTSGTPAVVRIPCGTVAAPKLPVPESCSLEDLPGEAVSFEFKVVDERDGSSRILGIASDVRPKPAGTQSDGTSSRSLLPVNPKALGQEIWRVDFEGPRPYLEVNSEIQNIMEIARSDSTFVSLVYPEVIRKILTYIMLVEEIDDAAIDSSWHGEWLEWATRIHPERTVPPSCEGANSKEDQLRWIEEVASEFSASRKMRSLFEDPLAKDGS